MARRSFYDVFFVLPDLREQGEWRPPVDVYETRRGWLLKCDLAGVRPEDVRVRIEGSRVTVEGLRRDLVMEEVSARYSMEISYNRFARTIELPCRLDDPRTELTVRDGFLLIHLRCLAPGKEGECEYQG